VYAVGYSNGANAAVGLMLRHPGLLAGGVLLRPMLPAPAPEGLDLAGTQVLVAGGRQDGMIPAAWVQGLLDVLRAAGAEVREHWDEGGHGLTQDDMRAAASWLASGAPSQPAGRRRAAAARRARRRRAARPAR
jgi:predicted esterase